MGNSLEGDRKKKWQHVLIAQDKAVSSLQHCKSCRVGWPGLQRGRDGMVWERQMLLQVRGYRLCHLPNQQLKQLLLGAQLVQQLFPAGSNPSDLVVRQGERFAACPCS